DGPAALDGAGSCRGKSRTSAVHRLRARAAAEADHQPVGSAAIAGGLAGVDGCRAGWVVAADSGAFVAASFAEILAERFDLVLIDIPIGLPDGPRACDLGARVLLGPRRSSVFPAPSRRLLRARR